MVYIQKKKGENNETIFRKFSRLFFEENISDEVRNRQFYVKPSQVRKEKEKNRNKRRRKTN